MKIRKIINAILLISLALLICRGTSVFATVTCNTLISSITISGTDISVQRDTTVGQPISNVITGPMQEVAQCSIDVDVFYINIEAVTTTSSGVSSYNGRAIFSTNVNGLGANLGINGGLTNPGRSNYYITSGNRSITINGISNTGKGTYPIYIQTLFHLIKTTQPISAGTVSGTIANIVIRQGSRSGPAIITIPVIFTNTVKVLACSIDNNTVNVPLETVSAGNFTGINSTQGEKSFTIGLSCDPNARINARMSFNTDGNDQSVIAVTGKGQAGVASGVGIQLLYGNTPLQNGTNVVLKTSQGGSELPTGAFTARYYQTQSTVMPGSANATATMTLTYQ